MHAAEHAFFKLSDAELRDALAVYESVSANVAVEPESPPTRTLDRVRVTDVPSDSTGEDYGALVAANAACGGGPAYVKWVGAIYFGDDPVCPEDGIIGVTAEGMKQLAAIDDFASEIDPAINVESNGFLSAHDWTVFAADGSWISTSWESNDFRALGASNAFMDAYIEAKPDAHDDALTWLDSEGHLFTESVPVRRAERPRAPKFLKGLLTRTEYEDRFENSTTGDFLTRLYGREVASELWQLHLDMGEFADPLMGDAWKELRALKKKRPEVETRLREIWDGAG